MQNYTLFRQDNTHTNCSSLFTPSYLHSSRPSWWGLCSCSSQEDHVNSKTGPPHLLSRNGGSTEGEEMHQISLVRLKIIQCARETGWGWRAEMWNFACESIQATTVYWLHWTSMNATSNIHFHIYKTSLLPVEWLGKAFKFLSWTKEGNWYLASHRTHFRGMLFRTVPIHPL